MCSGEVDVHPQPQGSLMSLHKLLANWQKTGVMPETKYGRGNERDLDATANSPSSRNSRAVAILWGVFTVCSAILNVVVFISPQWVGDTELSKGPGHFGLWRFCTVLSSSSDGSQERHLEWD